MENKQDYLAKVQVAVQQLHNCGAVWRETVPVHEVFQGKTVWQGDVEVFDLHGHPKAKRAYAWGHLDGANDERTRFVAVLEIPPVVSAETAVRVQIVKDVKEKEKHMNTLDIRPFGEESNSLEFWIPTDFTCKMIDHLRNKDIRVDIQLAAMDGDKTFRDRDSFIVAPVGKKERRAKIKESINGFCEKNGFPIPEWPKNF